MIMPDKLYRSYSLEKSAEGYSGSITLWEDSPVSPLNIGDTFTPVPNGPTLTINKISIKDSVIGEVAGKTVRQWEITIEGSQAGNPSGDDEQGLPNSETTITYEINGSTVRSVSGEFIALRRSQNPITKKSIVIYSNSDTAITTPGSTYEGGIVTSVNISKETIKNNGVVTASYYEHSIEVEA